MKTLTKAQRDYFVSRINEKVNKEVGDLKHLNAAGIERMANKQFKTYLKQIEVDSLLKEYKNLQDKLDKVKDKLQLVVEYVHNNVEYDGKTNWSQPNIYSPKDVEQFFRKICNALANDHFLTTPKGKRIKYLEDKRQKAIDVVMGMTETNLVVQEINKVLGKQLRLK